MAQATEKKIIERDLPAPVITDGTHSIMFLAKLLSSGEAHGATYEIDYSGFSYSVSVNFPDGTRKREVMNMKDMLAQWVTQMVEEGAA